MNKEALWSLGAVLATAILTGQANLASAAGAVLSFQEDVFRSLKGDASSAINLGDKATRRVGLI